ncbi:unnamed protein product [Parnassius apollo]|uniref:(apollo) hypothetical protein n=1 Tax=Parnassius apollo TaxID=110799 RepID=A0A8S3WE01_PARAO|nr:unnamed protein product [Parnassius apollo]
MDRAKKYLPQPLYPGSMQTASQNVCPGSNTGMHTAQPTYPVSMQNTFQPVYSTPMLNLPQFIHPGLANKILFRHECKINRNCEVVGVTQESLETSQC